MHRFAATQLTSVVGGCRYRGPLWRSRRLGSETGVFFVFGPPDGMPFDRLLQVKLSRRVWRIPVGQVCNFAQTSLNLGT